MLLLLFFLVSAGPSPKPAFTENRVPDAELISSVEAKVVMPAGAEPLTSYDRAYTQAKVDGKDYILGQMIDHRLMQEFAKHGSHPLPPPVRRVLVNEITPVFDGGCAILTLTFEVGSTEPPKLFCNPPGPQ